MGAGRMSELASVKSLHPGKMHLRSVTCIASAHLHLPFLEDRTKPTFVAVFLALALRMGAEVVSTAKIADAVAACICDRWFRSVGLMTW